MVKIKYTGLHQPQTEVEVSEQQAKEMLKNGDCEIVENGKTATTKNNRDKQIPAKPKKIESSEISES